MEPNFSAHAVDFDFDAWRDLAERDPKGFVCQRRRLIADAISSSGEHAGELAALQERIDAMRAVAGGPTMALRGLSAMMETQLRLLARQFGELQRELQGMRNRANRLAVIAEPAQPPGALKGRPDGEEHAARKRAAFLFAATPATHASLSAP